MEYSEDADSGCNLWESGELTHSPDLVKVDMYGSVRGLVRVRVPLGFIVIVSSSDVGGSFGS